MHRLDRHRALPTKLNDSEAGTWNLCSRLAVLIPLTSPTRLVSRSDAIVHGALTFRSMSRIRTPFFVSHRSTPRHTICSF